MSTPGPHESTESSSNNSPEELRLPDPVPPSYQAPEHLSPPQQPQYAPPRTGNQPPQYAAPQQPQYAPPQQPPYAAAEQPQYSAPQQPQYAPPEQPQYAASHDVPAPVAPPPQQPQYELPPQYAPPQHFPEPYAASVPGPGGYFDGAVHPSELGRPLYGASLGQAFTRFFRNYANFQGRASRSEYWWMALVYVCAFLLLGILGALFNSSQYSAFPSTGLAEMAQIFTGLAVFAVLIGTLVPTLALSWRRLHDANLPGPLYLLVLIPYLGSLVILILMLLGPRPEGRRFDRLAR